MQMLIIAGIGILITGIVLFNLEKIKKAINTKDLIKKFIYLALLFGTIELLHFLLKEIIYLEAITILSLFIVTYLIIISLFIAKKRGKFFIRHYILTFFLGVVVYNYVTYPSYTYRYRMTVEVETPEGLKTGSSVIEVKTSQWNSWATGVANGNNGQSQARGEGVLIEIEKKKSLLVLLERDWDVDHAEYMLPYTIPMKEWNVDWNKPEEDEKAWYGVKSRRARQYYGTLMNAKGVLPNSVLPTMFVISINEKKEVLADIIKPSDFENYFGKGVSIKNVIIETTKDKPEIKLRKLDIWSNISSNKKLRYKNF